jgi:predicted  nucleic acid-binding Zn-ribbon protein
MPIGVQQQPESRLTTQLPGATGTPKPIQGTGVGAAADHKRTADERTAHQSKDKDRPLEGDDAKRIDEQEQKLADELHAVSDKIQKSLDTTQDKTKKLAGVNTKNGLVGLIALGIVIGRNISHGKKTKAEKAAMEQATKQLDTASKAIRGHEKELRNLNEERQGLEADLESYEAKLSTYQTELATQQATLKIQQSSLNSHKPGTPQHTKISKQIVDTEKEIAATEEKIVASEEQIAATEADLAKNETKIDECKEKIQEAGQQAQQAVEDIKKRVPSPRPKREPKLSKRERIAAREREQAAKTAQQAGGGGEGQEAGAEAGAEADADELEDPAISAKTTDEDRAHEEELQEEEDDAEQHHVDGQHERIAEAEAEAARLAAEEQSRAIEANDKPLSVEAEKSVAAQVAKGPERADELQKSTAEAAKAKVDAGAEAKAGAAPTPGGPG